MGTFRDSDGSYKTYSDTSRSFQHDYEARAYEESLYTQQQPLPQGGSPYSGDASDVGLITVLKDSKPFYPVLILYWLIAFPAINASWLLRTAGFPFSWLGTILYYPWILLVKVVGAPYYLAYLFGDVGAMFAMPVIAIIWFIVLTIFIGRVKESRPSLVKKIFTALFIAAVIPVGLAVIAYLFGSLRGDVIQSFWYGHDPYTRLIWDLTGSSIGHLTYPGLGI